MKLLKSKLFLIVVVLLSLVCTMILCKMNAINAQRIRNRREFLESEIPHDIAVDFCQLGLLSNDMSDCEEPGLQIIYGDLRTILLDNFPVGTYRHEVNEILSEYARSCEKDAPQFDSVNFYDCYYRFGLESFDIRFSKNDDSLMEIR